MSRPPGGPAAGGSGGGGGLFSLDDDEDLLGGDVTSPLAGPGAQQQQQQQQQQWRQQWMGSSSPPPAHQQQHQQQQQQQQQQRRVSAPAVGALIDLGGSATSDALLAAVDAAAGAPPPTRPGPPPPPPSTVTSLAVPAAAPAAADPLFDSPPQVLSLRGAAAGHHAAGAQRTGSLGFGGDLISFDDDGDDAHPPDGYVDAAAAAGSGGGGGGGRRGAGAGAAGGRGGGGAAAKEGVHGGDAHRAEDEARRVVAVQTVSGEGALTRWQRFLRACGVRRRRPKGAFASNELVTSKYNALSFVPVNLYHQFRRAANMYFAGLVILQAIPGLSPVPWWGTLFPLAVVLLVNGVKEAFDDFGRHRSDARVNQRAVTALKEDGDQRVAWKALQVGDLVRLSNDEDVPADVVLLGSSDPDGLCYVETANLDGETNLKARFCLQATAPLDSAEAVARAGYFTVECEAPNARLYAFEGALCCWDLPPTLGAVGAMVAAAGGGGGGGGSRPAPARGPTAATAAAAARQELELAGGYYGAAAGREQQQQQQQQQRRPAGRSSPPRAARPRPGISALDDDGGGGGGGMTAALGAGAGAAVGLVWREPLDAGNLLLRGCTVRKTEWVIGVVVFTGPDTKVVRNMLPAPRKVTRLERAMNRVVLVVLCALGIAAVVLASANTAWELRHRPDARDWYLGPQAGWPELAPGVGAWLVQVVRFVILLAQAVPISLYVSLETVKVLQCRLLYDRDRLMYDAREDVPCTSRTTTLNEELGQVEYVLSDKTGTLTQNVMGFAWLSAGGRLYGPAGRRAQAALLRAGGAGGKDGGKAAAAAAAGVVVAPVGSDAPPPPNTPHTVALDPDLRAAAAAASAAAAAAAASPPSPSAAGSALGGGGGGGDVGGLLLALALCNTVVPTATDGGALLYQAASPDEEALVAGAAYLGTKLVSRSSAGVEVEVGGALRRYALLAVLEFSSDRKRMSVVVREPAALGGRLLLVSKGADNVMLARLAAGAGGAGGGGAGGGGSGADKKAKAAAAAAGALAATTAHLYQMSSAGYRTLVVAQRELPPETYQAWERRYKAACSAGGAERAARVAAACEELEGGLALLGATAVEDKLQDGVPEAIAALVSAGIKVWVLTGDKLETAVSVGHTARLLREGMGLLLVREADLLAAGHQPQQPHQPHEPQQPQPPPQAAAAGGTAAATAAAAAVAATSRAAAVAAGLEALLARAQALKRGGGGSGDQQHQAPAAAAAAAAAHGRDVGLVIDGAALAAALAPAHEDALLALCRECAAVVCCRVSPMQKAQVAALLKRKAGAVTLAIGDGANDVSMIQAAHVGVGISGREGRAAVQAADFAFGQFRFLVRLLLVHGRQSYLRCREVVLFSFYKNVAYVSAFVYFSAECGFSAQSLFFPLFIATFNSLWSAFPTLGYGLLEQDVPAAAALAHPELYHETRRETARDFYRAWAGWMALGLWHGAACYYLPARALAGAAAVGPWHGAHVTVAELGAAVFTSVVVTVTLRVAIRTSHWTRVNHALIWGTLALWLPFLGLLTGLCGAVPGVAPLCGIGAALFGAPAFWLAAVVGAPAAALLPDLAWLAFQRALRPRASQLLQEAAAARERERRRLLAGGGTAAAAAAAARQRQGLLAAEAGLPPLAPDAQPQFRQQQQQQQQQQQHAGVAAAGAAAAPPVSPPRRGAGIVAVAQMTPEEAAAAAAAAAAGGADDGRRQWQLPLGGGGGPSGPHTLGELAAGVAWAPNVIPASPETLARSHTKRQSRVPLSRLRHGGLGAPGGLGGGGAVAAAQRWDSLGRSASDAFGPAVRLQQQQQQQQQPQVAMQPLPPPPPPPATAGVSAGTSPAPAASRAPPSRLGGTPAPGAAAGGEQEQRAGPAFTLGGDDTL